MLRLLAGACALGFCLSAAGADYRQRLAQDEIIYFLLPDRFENGDPAMTAAA
jgi:hypothetical protein